MGLEKKIECEVRENLFGFCWFSICFKEWVFLVLGILVFVLVRFGTVGGRI